MNKELTDKLLKDFPILYILKTVEYFGQKSVPTAFSLYQFEHGDGWEKIIRGLSIRLETWNLVCNNQFNDLTEDNQCKALQVKEKFGGLRFYVTSAPQDLYGAIQEAEEESLGTCEDCGTKETVTTGTGRDVGWIRTLCWDCRQKWEIKRGVK